MSDSSPLCEILPWDSEFFGFKIARVSKESLTEFESEAIDRWCDLWGVRCLYFLTSSSDLDSPRIAEECGYHLVDIRLTFESQSPRAPDLGPRASIQMAAESDLEQLQHIARDSYRMTRFYADPNFDSARADDLYIEWVTKSVRGYAEAVLVAKEADHVLGFISCHLKPDTKTGTIGLVGVSEKARGKGVGKQVVHAGLDWFAQHAAENVTVVTQGRNLAAQRLYVSCGFLPKSSELYYHKWFE